MASTSTRPPILRSQRGRPSRAGLIVTAIGGMAAGLLLTQLSLEEDRFSREVTDPSEMEVGRTEAEVADAAAASAPTGPVAEDQGSTGDLPVAEDTSPMPATGEPTGAEPADLAVDGSPEAAEATAPPTPVVVAEPPAPVEPAEPVPQRARSSRTLEPGRVAYIRCSSGSRPCPRDRDLENAVWEVLRDLPLCAHLAKEGRADIRLHFARGKPPELRFKDFDGPGQILPYGSLSSCLESPLGRMRSSLDEESFVLSLRFELRSR